MFAIVQTELGARWHCGGVRHYNTTPRIASVEARYDRTPYGPFFARLDEWGNFVCKLGGRDVPLEEVIDKARKSKDGRWLRMCLELKRRIEKAELEVVT